MTAPSPRLPGGGPLPLPGHPVPGSGSHPPLLPGAARPAPGIPPIRGAGSVPAPVRGAEGGQGLPPCPARAPGAASPPHGGARGPSSSPPQAFPGAGGGDSGGATLEASSAPRSRPAPAADGQQRGRGLPDGGATPEGAGRPSAPPAEGRPAMYTPGDAAVRHPASPGVPTAAGREWVLELPAGLTLLSMNDRDHYMARHRKYQAVKKAAWAVTLRARLPRLDRVEVQGIYDPPDRRDRDGDNLAPTMKAVVDGIVATGRIGAGIPARPGQGDDSHYVARSWCEIGPEPYPKGRLRVIIREVTVPAGDAA